MINSINNYSKIVQSSATNKTENTGTADLFKQLLGKAMNTKTGDAQETIGDTGVETGQVQQNSLMQDFQTTAETFYQTSLNSGNIDQDLMNNLRELGKTLRIGTVDGQETISVGDTGVDETGQVHKTKSIGTLAEIFSLNNSTLTNSSSEIETKTDELIEKLSQYSSRLEDSTVSLKDIDSLLQEIKTNAENLLDKTQTSDGTNENLIDIARQCAITAQSEYIKFQRGDYIDSFA